MPEEFNNEELEFTPQVVEQEEAPIIAEEVVEAPKKVAKKATPKKEAKEEVKKVEKKSPGYYYEGKRITSIPARLGKKWTVVIDGKRQKVLKKDIEIVK